MSRLLKRPEAKDDLKEIWGYIAQDSPQNADKLLDRIQEKFLALADFPKMGISRDDLEDGLRAQPVGSYIIFYFPLEDGVDIVRVIHGSRDIESLLH